MPQKMCCAKNGYVNWKFVLLTKFLMSSKNIVLYNVLKKLPRGYRSEKTEGLMYTHQCEKISVKIAAKCFCTEEVLVENRNVFSKSLIRFLHPISRVI